MSVGNRLPAILSPNVNSIILVVVRKCSEVDSKSAIVADQRSNLALISSECQNYFTRFLSLYLTKKIILGFFVDCLRRQAKKSCLKSRFYSHDYQMTLKRSQIPPASSFDLFGDFPDYLTNLARWDLWTVSDSFQLHFDPSRQAFQILYSWTAPRLIVPNLQTL